MNWVKGPMGQLIVGSVLYQAVWFATVLSADQAAAWWWGLPVVVVSVAASIMIWPAKRARIVIMAITGLIVGLVMDSAMAALGVVTPSRSFLPAPVTPFWLLILWVGFGVYMATGLELMYGKPKLIFIGGAFGGMLAYRAGVGFGALTWSDPAWVGYGVLLVVWGVVFSALMKFAALLPLGSGFAMKVAKNA